MSETPSLSSSPTPTTSSLTAASADTPPITSAPSSDSSTSPSPPQPQRRKASYYPNVPSGGRASKPFSRSAAKRDSVMMLGSIEHLQHYFTKQGLQAKQKSSKIHSAVVPAIGPSLPLHLMSDSFTPSSSTFFADLPPSPAPPPPRPEVVLPVLPDMRETHDPALLRKEVIRSLDEVESLWALSPHGTSSTSDPPELDELVDVLHSLLRTTHLIRSVRNYVLSIPSTSPPEPSNQPAFRPPSFNPNPRPRISSASSATSNSSAKTVRPSADPSQLIRKAALDVLAQLRLFEESARLPGSGSAAAGVVDDGASEASSLGGPVHSKGHLDVSRGASPTPSHPAPHPIYDPDLSDSEQADASEEPKREAWDERLVLGGGFLYRMDLHLRDIVKEREAVGRYLDVVDQAIFAGREGENQTVRGWRKEKERRRVSASLAGAERRHSGGLPSGRRVVSAAGGLESVRFGGSVVEEPEELGGQHEGEEDERILGAGEGLGQLMEEDEDEEGQQEEEEGDRSMSEDEMPDWARGDLFVGDLAGRTYALLQTLLPPALLEHLPSPPPTTTYSFADTLSPSITLPASSYHSTLLQSLSSGQLLCVAYNSAVRSSSKPWGYISQSGIHDIVALEHADPPSHPPEDPRYIPQQLTGQHTGSKGKEGGWTFRRTENLRLWAAACKLRYSIPFALPMPSGISSSQAHSTSTRIPGIPKGVEPVWFDPKVVATRVDGWEGMLERGLGEWVGRVVEERRDEAKKR